MKHTPKLPSTYIEQARESFRHGHGRRVAGLLLSVLILHGGVAWGQEFTEMAVVTNRGAALDSADSEELARAYLALSNKIEGGRYKVVNLEDEDLRFEFLERLTGMSAVEIDEHFVQLELRAEGNWPVAVSEAAELIRLVAASKVVVGWLPATDLEGLSEKQRAVLKVLAIDGKRPSEAQYLLGPRGQ